jgi:hypothetical protein
LTSVLLARFDVLVATEEALRSLGGDERAALEAAIRTAGLGLLVVGEPIAGTVATPLTPWQITPAANDAESMVRATRVRLVGGRTWPEPLEVWVATWSEHPLMRALLRDPQGDVLAALEPLGSGRVARSLVAESWRWRLTGQTADYAALWHDVLAAVARQEVPRGQWRLVPAGGVITAGQPVDVTWLGDAENAPPFARLRDGDGSEVAILRLRQLGDQPGEAAARWWPAQPGWHRLENETGQGIDLHVSPPSEWPGLERAMCRDATRELVRATAELRPAEPVTDAPNDRRQWRWGAWVVFVIALGALWWRERGAV